MRGAVYPYQVRLRPSGSMETLPLVLCTLSTHPNNSLTFLALLDSGAQITLLPTSDAEALGIVLENGQRITVSGISGEEITGYRHTVTMDTGGTSFRTSIIFATRDDVPRVLGREDIFKRFFVIFDEKHHRTVLVTHSISGDAFFEEKIIRHLA